jgi:hypothetical protein
MVELVSIGKERLAHGYLQQAKSKDALQAQIQSHKVRHTGQSLCVQGETIRCLLGLFVSVRVLVYGRDPGNV